MYIVIRYLAGDSCQTSGSDTSQTVDHKELTQVTLWGPMLRHKPGQYPGVFHPRMVHIGQRYMKMLCHVKVHEVTCGSRVYECFKGMLLAQTFFFREAFIIYTDDGLRHIPPPPKKRTNLCQGFPRMITSYSTRICGNPVKRSITAESKGYSGV